MQEELVLLALEHSKTVDYMNEDREGILHYWRQTGLLSAWKRGKQVEAIRKASEIFPNLHEDMGLSSDASFMVEELMNPDDEADLGAAFMDTEDEDEWREWIDWSAV